MANEPHWTQHPNFRHWSLAPETALPSIGAGERSTALSRQALIPALDSSWAWPAPQRRAVDDAHVRSLHD